MSHQGLLFNWFCSGGEEHFGQEPTAQNHGGNHRVARREQRGAAARLPCALLHRDRALHKQTPGVGVRTRRLRAASPEPGAGNAIYKQKEAAQRTSN